MTELRAPSTRCPTPPDGSPRAAPSLGPDIAPLMVRATVKGLSLQSRGARAERVLTELAAASKRGPWHVEGFGAAVRIYADVANGSFEEITKHVAIAAGLDRRLVVGSTTYMDDVGDVVSRERQAAAHLLSLSPMETRSVPTKRAREIGAALAETLLGCRGMIVVSSEPTLVVRDQWQNIDAIVAVAERLEASEPIDQQLRVPLDDEGRYWPMRADQFGVPDPVVPACDAIETKAPPLLAESAPTSTTVAPGELMLVAAHRRHEDVIVGCGGDRPVVFTPTKPLGVEALGVELGLWRVADGPFVAVGPAYRAELARVHPKGIAPPRLRSVRTPHASALVPIVRAFTGISEASGVAFVAPDLLLVAGGDATRARVGALVLEWQAR